MKSKVGIPARNVADVFKTLLVRKGQSGNAGDGSSVEPKDSFGLEKLS